METLMIDPLHVRMAMAAMGVSTAELGRHVGVVGATVRKFAQGNYSVASRTVSEIEKYFVGKGIVFLDGPEGLGIRVQKR